MSNPQQDPLWAIRDLIEQQTWYQKFSNTVTAGVGAAVGGVWFASSVGFDIPDDVTKWGFVVIGVLTTLGIRKTQNGVTESQLEKIKEKYQSRLE